MKHKKLWIFLFTALFLFALTSCGSGRSKIYNTNTLQTSTEFGFTDGGDARVTVSYFGYESTEDANIHIKIEKQGFFIFWNTVIDQDFEANGQNYQNEFFYPITDNGKYRCTVTYTIFGAEEDDIIVFKDEKTYQKEDFHAEATDTSEASVTESTPTETTTAETTTAETTTAETTTEETTTAEPSESEEAKALRLRYEAAVEAMNEYLKVYTLPADINKMDREAAEKAINEYNSKMAEKAKMPTYLYAEFSALGDYKDSKEYLSHFIVLPDMLTSIVLTKTNANGKTTETEIGSYTYAKDGTLLYASGEDLDVLSEFIKSEEMEYEFNYNISGEKILISQKNDTTSTFIPASNYTLSENGKLIRFQQDSFMNPYNLSNPSSTQVYTYIYNEHGDLITKKSKTVITGHPNNLSANYRNEYITTETWDYLHTYDDNGTITQTTITHNCFYEQTCYVTKPSNPFNYSYYTIQTEMKSRSDPTTKTVRNYTTDENGRILSAEIIDESKPNTEQHLTYHYETLYFYQK